MSANRRVLIIDDLVSIHEDYRKILGPKTSSGDALNAARAAFLKTDTAAPADNIEQPFELTFAEQGKEGYNLACSAQKSGHPFAVAFVDMRMPPGWDGLETIAHLWETCPSLQTVICTAHSDYSWQETIERLGQTDRLLILKKPFDAIEVRQLAEALSQKWDLSHCAELKLSQLAEMVAERTQDLEHARNELLLVNASLEESKQAAEAANRSKSEFLANMSHEIRTPTSVIIGYADVLCETKQVDLKLREQREALEAIRRNGEYLLTIINDILDISKIEAGKLQIERVVCSPRAIITDTLQLLSVAADLKSVTLRANLPDDLPEWIQTDPMRAKQILTNLIGNAIKFTEHGEVSVSARLNTSGDEPRLDFEIRDQGIGMTPEQVQRLFQPFTQADSSMSRRFGGTGLGLVISNSLATMLGGEVRVKETQHGVGTCMLASLATGPLDVDPPADQSAISQEVEFSDSGEVESDASLACRVLLAEDGLDNQRLISFVLRKAGATVTIVENGRLALEEALKAAEEKAPYAVILMDMQMPEMTGYEAAEELRRRGYEGPIIALTAQALADDKAKSLDAGCDMYLAKPFKRAELVELVRHYARKAQAPANKR